MILHRGLREKSRVQFRECEDLKKFGFVPYRIFLLFLQLQFHGALICMSGIHSFWYHPQG